MEPSQIELAHVPGMFPSLVSHEDISALLLDFDHYWFLPFLLLRILCFFIVDPVLLELFLVDSAEALIDEGIHVSFAEISLEGLL